MPRTRFHYFSPQTLKEAIEILQKHENACVMAGGTDLLPKLRKGLIQSKVVVGLKNIEGLDRIDYTQDKGLTIGAMALLADVARHEAIRKHYSGIAEAARNTANVQIRNMGTVIGNLCNASPSADNVPMLLVLEGTLDIEGPDGKRDLPLKDFFQGPGMTNLSRQEIVTSVHVPPPQPSTGAAYLSLSARGQVDCAAVGVAVKLTMDGNTCKDIKVAVSACAPTPLRVPEAEACLRGRPLSKTLIDQAVKMTVEKIRPIDDVRASASYRSTMVAVLVKRSLTAAMHNVK